MISQIINAVKPNQNQCALNLKANFCRCLIQKVVLLLSIKNLLSIDDFATLFHVDQEINNCISFFFLFHKKTFVKFM